MIAVSAKNLSKSFGSTLVLRGVSVDVMGGEVHVLAGENGAGKSTFIKILAGVYSDFEGDLHYLGAPCRFANPLAARRAGIATIHQELSLVGPMSIADNLFLGREQKEQWGWIKTKDQEDEAREMIKAFGIDMDPRLPVETLPIATQQLLEIAKALMEEAKLFIFDEPTSALDEPEAEWLFSRLLELKKQGKAILFVSHRMEDIYRVGDRMTVLRDGKCVVTAAASDLPRDELVAEMLGREQASGVDKRRVSEKDSGAGEGAGEEASAAGVRTRLEVKRLTVPHPRLDGRYDVDDVTFSLEAGEIVGLAGLRGCGASALLEAIYGARGAMDSGYLELDRRRLLIRDPGYALKHGVAFLPSDRQQAFVIPALSVIANATLASLRRFVKGPWRMADAERQAVVQLVKPLNLRNVVLDAEVGTLSGGSQQKVCLSRCLLTGPKVLLLDEPTRGVDVGAKAELHSFIQKLAREGTSVLFYTSDLEELLALASRILIMVQGRIVSELPRTEATREKVLQMAMEKGNGE